MNNIVLLVGLVLFVFSPSAWAVTNPNGVAVIIGNKLYKGDIPTVDYADRDAEAIKRYVLDVLGYDPENIIDLRDASKAQMEAAFGNGGNHKGRLWQYLDPNGGSDILIYYSGHGVPGQNDKRSYLLPADSDPAFAEINGYPIDVLYKNLGKLKARSKIVLIDACFSGASPKGMLIKSASPVFIRAKASEVGDDLTVLTAASGDQLASWDKDSGYGLFTNYFLEAVYGKADANKDGNVSVVEVKAFLDDKMTRAARRSYRRIQEATLLGNTDQVMSKFKKGAPPSRPLINSTFASLGKFPSPPNLESTILPVLPKAIYKTPPAFPKGTMKDQYKFAFNLLRKARYQEAEIAFKDFLNSYADDPLAGNAQYWLSETYYVRKDFMQAAQSFFMVYKKFPTGVKAPDSLLKLGMSMAALGKTKEACTTFGKLRVAFSGNLKSNVQRALNKQISRLNCR